MDEILQLRSPEGRSALGGSCPRCFRQQNHKGERPAVTALTAQNFDLAREKSEAGAERRVARPALQRGHFERSGFPAQRERRQWLDGYRSGKIGQAPEQPRGGEHIAPFVATRVENARSRIHRVADEGDLFPESSDFSDDYRPAMQGRAEIGADAEVPLILVATGREPVVGRKTRAHDPRVVAVGPETPGGDDFVADVLVN